MEERVIVTNKKAYHDYHISETYESGIALTGNEVKAVREGRINLKDSYAAIRDGEVWLLNCHISPYSHAAAYTKYDPERPRKLLLHRQEIKRLLGKVAERGFTLVPLRVYLSKRNLVKVQLGLAKGKKLYDKREAERRRDLEREIRSALKKT